MTNDLDQFREWFRRWGACVAAVDYAAARPLFAAGVIGFGTHAAFVTGLNALQDEQWSKVWPKITGFEFLVDDLVGAVSIDMAWAATPWTSTGYHEDGTPFSRPGRATVTFRREGHPLARHPHPFLPRPRHPAEDVRTGHRCRLIEAIGGR